MSGKPPRKFRNRPASPAVLMAIGTALSRVTGFGRTAAVASALGLTTLADAYNGAAALPTMVLVLVTGGTLSAAVVPLLVRPESADARRNVAGSVLVLVAAVTAGATVLLALVSPALGRLLSVSSPAATRQERAQLTGELLLLFSPQLFLLGLSVIATAILTAAGRLARVGVTPVLSNVVTLVGIAVYVLLPEGPAGTVTGLALLALGAGSTLGVAVTTAAQLRGCRDLLPPLRALVHNFDRGPLRELAAVSRWSLVYVAANQVGLVVVLIVAGKATGVLSAYQWAFAVMQLPYAILAVTVLSASYPALTRAAGDIPTLTVLVRRSVGLLLLLLLPAAATVALFADVLSSALLGVGASPVDVALLTTGVRLFAIALLPFALFQLLNRISYALRVPRLPALTNLVVNTATIAGAVLAARSATPSGLLTVLALSYAASYVVGCAVLVRCLGAAAEGVLHPEHKLVFAVSAPLASIAVAAALRASTTALWADGLALALLIVPGAIVLRTAVRMRAAPVTQTPSSTLAGTTDATPVRASVPSGVGAGVQETQ